MLRRRQLIDIATECMAIQYRENPIESSVREGVNESPKSQGRYRDTSYPKMRHII